MIGRVGASPYVTETSSEAATDFGLQLQMDNHGEGDGQGFSGEEVGGFEALLRVPFIEKGEAGRWRSRELIMANNGSLCVYVSRLRASN